MFYGIIVRVKTGGIFPGCKRGGRKMGITAIFGFEWK